MSGTPFDAGVRFADRTDAGRRLAALLRERYDGDVVVVGMARGGVPVAFEVARALGAPLDVIVVRKLGVPWQPELGVGAIAEGGVRLLNDEVVRMTRIGERDIADVEARERAELERRAAKFRGDRSPQRVAGRVVIVVDDGVATGSTARAACRAVRARGASRIVLAVPVGPVGVELRMTPDADEVVCLETPQTFFAVGEHYANFTQTTDDEVVALMQRVTDATHDLDVVVDTAGASLPGRLTVPTGARGVVVFAHGSGSSHASRRAVFVARSLVDGRLATLLFDLIMPDEARGTRDVFDIDLLAARLGSVTAWLRDQSAVRGLATGLFGADTGAAAALRVAAADPVVAAVVGCGGRLDLAGSALSRVRAPTLLVVGGADGVVLDVNREAQQRLACVNRLEVVPGATHLLEEPGALETVADLARDWFVRYLVEAESLV